MTVAHGAGPEVEVETAVHRLAPECKVLALLVFAFAVALVPAREWVPYAVDLALLAAVGAWARVPLSLVGPRLLVEVPFVLFVVLLPFVSGGETTGVLGLSLSVGGLWTAFAIASKATLVVLATAVLSATTTAPEVLIGLERLRVPRTLVAIAGFAIRYLQVVLDELRRGQQARAARGDDPRWLWQSRHVARTAGALAIRCFERGERVHRAMLARGFDGRMPDVGLAAPAALPSYAVALLAVAPAVVALGAVA